MFYVNEDVRALHRIFDQNSRDGYLRMDLNENPGGLPEAFVKDVLGKVTPELVAKYPETAEFQRYLAGSIGVGPEQICLTNGSAEAIRHIFEVYSRPGGKIVAVSPSYAMYEIYAKMYGRAFTPVPYKDAFSVSVDSIVQTIDDETDIVVVLNPNNPVGDTYTYAEARRIIDAAQAHEATVVIDEAYYYFYPNSFLEFVEQYDHVLITRTFSKLFSLAGCRLGYCVGRPEDVALVQKMCTPHNVNAFGLLFATEIMKKDGMVEELVRQQLEGKRYLAERLKRAGYEVNAREGNFIFVRPKTGAAQVTGKLKEKGILVKHYTEAPYDEYIRVSTGVKEIMERFLEVFFAVDREEERP